MRIGYDAKRIFHNETGLGTYSRSLVSAIKKLDPAFQLHLYTPSNPQHSYSQSYSEEEGYKLHEPSRGSQNTWRNRRIVRDLKRDHIQIYHGLSNELPRRIDRTSIKTVVTIHDVLFKRFPADFPVVDRMIYNWKWKRSCRMADRIIAVSESTKKDLFDYYNVPFKKVTVIPPFIDPGFHTLRAQTQLEATRKKLMLPQEFILYVGAVRERKNLLSAMKAFDRLTADERIPFVIVGKGGKYFKKVEAYVESKPWSEKVVWLDKYLEQTELRDLFQLAKVFVYPSIAEGFGHLSGLV